ncbi:MAG: RNA polymerase sigma factor, partial [Candidatus Competibacterales bacterium]
MQMSAQNQTSCGSLDLLPRVSTGDPEAVAQCIERYGGLVWSLARRWFPVYADAEDAVQEAFIEIWQNAHRYDPAQGSEQLFVVLLTRRRLIDRLRKQGRRPINVPLDESGLTEALGDEGELVEQSVDAHFA